ncbi:MAG: competence protein ComEC [Gammaproteobacteria bacterium]|jgi:competence protein ComEC
MPRYTLAIVAGALLAFYGNQLFDRFWSAYLPLLLFFSWAIPQYRLLLILLCSLLWANAFLHYQLDSRLALQQDHQVFVLQAKVVDVGERDSHRLRLYLEPQSIENFSGRLPTLIRLNWYQTKEMPEAGESWRLVAKLKTPRGLMNPGSFDFERWQFVKGIDAVGYVKQSPLNRRLHLSPWWSVDRFRQRLASNLQLLCPSCQHIGLVKALIIGVRHDIPKTQNQLLVATGTAHLLAISGLHVGIIASLFFVIGRLFWRLALHRSGISRNRVAALFAIGAALAYAALAGFSLPTVRAMIMLLVLLTAQLCGNRINLMQSLCWVVAIIVILDPRSVGSSSFWLSVGAVLIIAYAQFKNITALSWWRQLFVLQFYFTLLFLPLGILIFGQLTPSSFVANIIAIPLVGMLVLPLILMTVVTVLLNWSMSEWLLELIDFLLSRLMAYLGWLNESGLEVIPSAAIPVFLLLMLLMLMPVLLSPAARYFSKPIIVLLLIPFFIEPAELDHGDFEMTVLDVGMGTSMLLRTRNHNLIYDLGPASRFGYSAADWAMLPALKLKGIGQADLIVISHVDQDHSGGFISLLDNYRRARLLSGTPKELQQRFKLDHRIRSCHRYPKWHWDGVSFEFLSTLPFSANSSTNNRSCVLLVNGYHRALIPGDIESLQEAVLVQQQAPRLNADVLIVPHHGSNTSSSELFLNSVSPQQAIFTLAHGNRWGFPKPEVVARYEQMRVNYLRTDENGAIEVNSSKRGLKIKPFRRAERIWR